MPEYYEIVVEGRLDLGWAAWFAGMELVCAGEHDTRIAGELPDQAALHGMLERIRDLNLRLISVNRLGPDG